MKIKNLLFVLLTTFIHSQSFPACAEILPVEAFGKLPDVISINLSPDGKKLASLVRLESNNFEGTAVAVYDFENKKNQVIGHTDNIKHVVHGIGWGNNDTLLISTIFPAVRYGVPTTETRMIKADIHSGIKDNVISKKYYYRYDWIPQFQANIIDILPEDNDHILMGLDTSEPGLEQVYQINLLTGHQTRVQKQKNNVESWLTDRQHRVRLGIQRDDTEINILVKDLKSEKWIKRWQHEVFEENATWPIGFDHDPDRLYLRAYHEGRMAIFSTDLTDASGKMELVLSDKNYDISGRLIYSQLKQKVVGTTYSNEGGGYTFWDPEYKAFQRGIDHALPETKNFIYDWSLDERIYLVLATNDREPGTYYLGNRDTKSLSPVAYRYARLKPDQMRPKKPVTYHARDGLAIEGFLTLPEEGERPYPTLIFPHGGPISYDDGGFDYWTQFFANRGYAVLQMNFRGSDGYGYDFMKAGLQNWGKEMQDDIEDGARWLMTQGIADQKQMCIAGASYGGYAALMGAITTPDLYRCVISFAGVSDVASLVKSHRRYTGYEIVKKQVGDDFSELKKISPLYHADKIKAPVLLIHGSKDNTVRVSQSRDMYKALQKADKDVIYLELENGTHYLQHSDRRLKTFIAMDEFLATHLPVSR